LTGSARFKTRAGSAALVIILTGIVVLWRTFTWEASVHELTFAHELVQRVSEVSSRLTDAELAARSFLSGADGPANSARLRRCLDDLREAASAAAEVERLAGLQTEAAESVPHRDMRTIRSLIDREAEILVPAIQAGDRGAIVRALDELDRAEITASSRETIRRLETAERAHLHTRLDRMDRNEIRAHQVLLARAAIAIFLFLGVGWLVLSDITGREKAERTLAAREAQYRQVVELAGDIIYRTDEQGRFTFLNQTALSMLHYTEVEIMGRSYLKLVRNTSRRGVERFYLRQLVRRQKSTYHEFPVIDGYGHERWIGQNVQLVFDEAKKVLGFQAIARDVTERKRAEFELRKSQTLVERIASTTPGILYVYDLDSRLNIFNNREIIAVLGYAPEHLQGLDIAQQIIHPDDRGMIQAHYESLRHAPDNEVRRLQYRARHADGHWVWLSGRETPFERGENGLVKQVVGISQDVTARKAAEEKLAYQANYDALTGLLNRQHFGTRLQNALRIASLASGEIAICLFDVDYFKEVNDRYGHRAGDEVLEEVGNVVRGELRTHDLAGRLGGDEFCVALPATGLQEALRVAERIRERLGTLAFGMNTGSAFSVTATFGVAESHPDISVKDLLEAADRALYRAKSAGRNRVCADA
jgi:diguanylate cyclase (GGDEF)-like protein/PAS domain S-box-containing protein